MFLSLSQDQAAVIRQKLLESLGGDFQRAVRNKISDAVAEVARQYTENSTSTPTFCSSMLWDVPTLTPWQMIPGPSCWAVSSNLA